MDKAPKKGDKRKFIIEATFEDDSNDHHNAWNISVVDGVDVTQMEDMPLGDDSAEETAEPAKGAAVSIITAQPTEGEMPKGMPKGMMNKEQEMQM